MTLATEMGTLRLVMRSPDDSAEGVAGGASIKDIFGRSDKLEREAEEARPPQANPDATAWLEQQRQAGQGGQPGGPVAPVVPQRPRPWRMTLLEGSEVRQVDLDGENQFPDLTSELPDENQQNDAPVDLGGDSQELPPVQELPPGEAAPPAEEAGEPQEN